MKFCCVNAKGKHTISLQDKYDKILCEAEQKLLDATLDVLRQDEQHYLSRCTDEKQQISAAIQTWKDSLKASKSSLDLEVEQFVALAKQFAHEFYFECYQDLQTSRGDSQTCQKSKTERRANGNGIPAQRAIHKAHGCSLSAKKSPNSKMRLLQQEQRDPSPKFRTQSKIQIYVQKQNTKW